jgi:hypothetical protein
MPSRCRRDLLRDLGQYTYRPDNRGGALNVGWLGETVPRCEVPSETFLDAPWQFLTLQFQQLRGFHYCEICPADPAFSERVRANGRRITMPVEERDARHRSIVVSRRAATTRSG